MGRIDPRVRVAAGVFFALVVVSLDRPTALLAALGLAAGLAATARLDPKATLRRLVALDGFMLFVLVFLPFSVPGEPIVTLGNFSASREG
ncbi:MAG: hypothetical protein WCF85_04935 [Rhodospirillaceae bacterium]